MYVGAKTKHINYYALRAILDAIDYSAVALTTKGAPSLGIHRSGRNTKGSFQVFGSRPMPYGKKPISVPAGRVVPSGRVSYEEEAEDGEQEREREQGEGESDVCV